MSRDEEQALIFHLLAEYIAKQMKIDKKPEPSKLDFLNKALASKRLLPGAKLIRSGRPLTDYLAKIKKTQRRAIKGEAIKYRSKSVKGPQKALVNDTRKQARKAYRKK